MVGTAQERLCPPYESMHHAARSSRAEAPLAGLVEMVADDAAERGEIAELELDGERHDAVGHAVAAAQACEIFFRRHQDELLALGVGCER